MTPIESTATSLVACDAWMMKIRPGAASQRGYPHGPFTAHAGLW